VERLAAFARGADLVAMCEPPLDLDDDALLTLFPEHEIVRCQPDDAKTYDARIVVLSRRHIPAITIHTDWRFERRPYALLRLEGLDAVVALIHAASSAWPGGLKQRDAAIEHLGRWLAPEPRWIALGDFNTTAWVPAFEALRPFRLGPPFFRRTWRAVPPVYGLPLDHALASPGVAAELSYGPWNGSDHRAVVLKLSA
jgi:endonuclease/exonuclease/phosphatase (EEP) superfamily protein YafD